MQPITMATTPDNVVQELTNGNGNDAAPQTLTLRMIMQGKEAGSIIGKKGDNVRKFREESGAKINISDSSCPERIVTVTGTTDQIYKAFTMISKKFEEDIINTHNSTTLPKPPVTVRLIVPASQCGSLIGKGGAKIKEIRELTGASIQVASEMLPNSTERAVTISGTADAITQCIYNICCVMLESPPKGATIPYRPKPSSLTPVIMSPGQAFSVQGQLVVPQADPRTAPAQPHNHPQQVPFQHPHLQHTNMVPIQAPLPPQITKIALQQGLIAPQPMPLIGTQPGLVPAGFTAPGLQPAFSPRQAVPTSGGNSPAQTHEITIPNDLIGCIIGRGGAKINEIRQLSGATIKIANAEEGSGDRKVTIMGSPETIHAAQYLINASVEMHKQLLAMNELQSANQAAAAAAAVPASIPLASVATNTQPLTAVSLGSPLTPLAIPISPLVKPMPVVGFNQAAPSATMGAVFDNKALTTKMKVAPTSMATAAMLASAAAKQKTTKFSPY